MTKPKQTIKELNEKRLLAALKYIDLVISSREVAYAAHPLLVSAAFLLDHAIEIQTHPEEHGI